MMLMITPFTSSISISDAKHKNNVPIKPFTFDELIRFLLLLVARFTFASTFLSWLFLLWCDANPGGGEL